MALRIAAFQRKPLFDDVPRTTKRILADLEWCDTHHIQVAVFPECYLQGYASDRKTIEARAVSLDGSEITALLSTLAWSRTTIVLGLIERSGTTCHNTAAVINGNHIVGIYRKRHTNERGFDPGHTSPVFKAHGCQFGINICYDANFPDAAAELRKQGAQLICYPLNNMLSPATAAKWRSKSIENLQDRARETGCWVVSADVVGNHGEKMSYGCTCIVQPDGSLIQQVAEGCEGIISFNLTV